MIIKGKTLFAVVDSQDPFMPSLIEGEKQAGPILSLMASKRFNLLSLVHTAETKAKALETLLEVAHRFPDCEVVLQELPDSEPGDPSKLIRNLSRQFRKSVRMARDCDFHVSMSSGSPQMRAALLYLVTTGELPGSLLRVGSPAERLFGLPTVRETQPEVPERTRAGSSGESSPHHSDTLEVERQMELLEAGLAPAPAGALPPEVEDALKEEGIILYSAEMRNAARNISKVARADVSILLLGEHGTGKELFARLVHRLSGRRENAYVPINCGGVHPNLIASDLFGHQKGAFTDAVEARRGAFDQADGGTLFLDEIGDFPSDLQAMLLRALQECEIQPLGASQPKKVDVRVVAATNRNLKSMMEGGQFRQDLYYRLNGMEIVLPPLRERRDDIPGLAVIFLKILNDKHDRNRRLAKSTMRLILEYPWPGNVRQLYRSLERGVLLSDEGAIEPGDLKLDTAPAGRPFFDSLPIPHEGFDLKNFEGQVHAHYIHKALSITGGNQSKAAKLLGIKKQSISEFLAREDDRRA